MTVWKPVRWELHGITEQRVKQRLYTESWPTQGMYTYCREADQQLSLMTQALVWGLEEGLWR